VAVESDDVEVFLSTRQFWRNAGLGGGWDLAEREFTIKKGGQTEVILLIPKELQDPTSRQILVHNSIAENQESVGAVAAEKPI
jgi:hypothetical protein